MAKEVEEAAAVFQRATADESKLAKQGATLRARTEDGEADKTALAHLEERLRHVEARAGHAYAAETNAAK